MSSFKTSENIQKKADGPDRSVSDNQSSSLTLNELAMKARKVLKNRHKTVGGVAHTKYLLHWGTEGRNDGPTKRRKDGRTGS